MIAKLKFWWLSRQLCRGNGEKREAAARALGKMGNRRAIISLIECLGDQDGSIRKTAAESLSKLGEPAWAQWCNGPQEEFLKRLAASGDERALYPIIYSLGFFHNGFCMQLAAEALAELGDKRAVEPLCKALRQGCETGRLSAAKALGELGDKRAIESLIQAIQHDDNTSVVCQSRMALIKLKKGADEF